jgi:hypothetical protein
MNTKFEAFLSRLETKNNKTLIEAIRKGFKAITEGYGDLREAPVQAIDMFNQQAAMTASSMGNNVLNFLNYSAEQRINMFTVDEEPELDWMTTSPFNQYVEKVPEYDEIENDLGLTAGEL